MKVVLMAARTGAWESNVVIPTTPLASLLLLHRRP